MKNKKWLINVLMLLLISVIAFANHQTLSGKPYEHFGQLLDIDWIKINGNVVQGNVYDKKIIGPLGGNKVNIEVKVNNIEKRGCMRLEAGIYNIKDADSWFPRGGSLSALTLFARNTNSCIASEQERNIVMTKEVCGEKGDSGVVTFSFDALPICDDEKYALVINSYECCYEDTKRGTVNKQEGSKCSLSQFDENYFAGQYKRVDLKNTGYNYGACLCQDNKKDSDETDIDCGGLVCAKKCERGNKCKQDADCANPRDNECREGTCQAYENCGDGIKNRDEEKTDCGGKYCNPCVSPTPQKPEQPKTVTEAVQGFLSLDTDLFLFYSAVAAIIVGAIIAWLNFPTTGVIFISIGVLIIVIKLILG